MSATQSPEWMRGFNDGAASSVEELLLRWEPQAAEELMHMVQVDELSREKVRCLRSLARRHKADKIVEALRTAKADRRTPPEDR